jgi:SOS-response transcriptional repressor LexA
MPHRRRPPSKYRPQPAGLTHQQARALAFIRQQITDEGVAPSLRLLAGKLGLQARSSALRILDALENRGWITRSPGRARSITLTHEPVSLIAALPDDLKLEVARIALKAKVDPDLVVIEAARDGIAAYRRRRDLADARARL